MKKNAEEFARTQSNYMANLTSLGRHYTSIIQGAAHLLHQDYLGKIQLSEDDKEHFFNALTETATRHTELIEQTIKELQVYINSMQEEDNG